MTFAPDPQWERDVAVLADDPAFEEVLSMATLWGTNGLDPTYVSALTHRERHAALQVLERIMDARQRAIDAAVRTARTQA